MVRKLLLSCVLVQTALVIVSRLLLSGTLLLSGVLGQAKHVQPVHLSAEVLLSGVMVMLRQLWLLCFFLLACKCIHECMCADM